MQIRLDLMKVNDTAECTLQSVIQTAENTAQLLEEVERTTNSIRHTVESIRSTERSISSMSYNTDCGIIWDQPCSEILVKNQQAMANEIQPSRRGYSNHDLTCGPSAFYNYTVQPFVALEKLTYSQANPSFTSDDSCKIDQLTFCMNFMVS